MRLFRAHGWAGTTLAAVAEEAGVAVETIYNGFGSKKALLRAAADASIVGDAEPIPLVDRPEFQALSEGTLGERMGRGARLLADIHERSAGIWQAVVTAAGADDEVDGWRLEWEQGRRLDVRRSAERIFQRELDEQTVTALWILYSPDTYLRLVQDSGMTRAAFEAFIAETTLALVGSRAG